MLDALPGPSDGRPGGRKGRGSRFVNPTVTLMITVQPALVGA
jgi:hypothetical protein